MVAWIVLSVFVAVAVAAPRYGVDSRVGAAQRSGASGPTVLSARASLRSDVVALWSALTHRAHRGAAG